MSRCVLRLPERERASIRCALPLLRPGRAGSLQFAGDFAHGYDGHRSSRGESRDVDSLEEVSRRVIVRSRKQQPKDDCPDGQELKLVAVVTRHSCGSWRALRRALRSGRTDF